MFSVFVPILAVLRLEATHHWSPSWKQKNLQGLWHHAHFLASRCRGLWRGNCDPQLLAPTRSTNLYNCNSLYDSWQVYMWSINKTSRLWNAQLFLEPTHNILQAISWWEPNVHRKKFSYDSSACLIKFISLTVQRASPKRWATLQYAAGVAKTQKWWQPDTLWTQTFLCKCSSSVFVASAGHTDTGRYHSSF